MAGAFSKEPDPEEREKAVWAYINHAFSKPVSADPLSMEYIPTQILAELFRKNGFDGIMYKSLLGTGFNVAIFDINAAVLVNCFLFEAKSIAFKFEEAANPYSIGRKD